jgi:predicted O-methyltransferase YrrM
MTEAIDSEPTIANAAAGDPRPEVSVEEALFQVLLRCYGRTPTSRDLELWYDKLKRQKASVFVMQLARVRPFLANRQVPVKNPAGHYFSPVVDPETVVDYVARERTARVGDVPGIDFDLEAMERFWRSHRDAIAATPFSDTPDGMHRYCYEGGPYNHGDGIMLRAMVQAFRPRRVVEIGSGYSTACMLDSAEEFRLDDFQITCIEPYPTRLKSVLRKEDEARVRIIEQGVQGIDLEIFRQLERNDILFIDSTHVLKTGSDVHYELFHILPVLKPGVVVHFHDCRWPLEYSDKQIFEKNYSWNEAYGVRALLMWSTRLRVLFSGSLFALERPELVAEVCPAFLTNPGSAIWVQVQDY